ncbi:hypothetical protein HAX54_040143 [Datura stramonium]|uniref:Uncharacterized protein n=1 Tax=Datura stramonium TaxID=4076 RepID=A0ABS8VPP4_DATST|nr:hypothetical protein [Datura stramonium]
MVEQDSGNSFLEDRTCWAALYVTGVCSKSKLPLIYLALDPTDESFKTFVRQSYNICKMAVMFSTEAIPKTVGIYDLGPNEEFTLRSFSYCELEQATEHFKEEIRHGSFGNL